MSTFSDNLSHLRLERRLSQRAVAQQLGISQALLSHYEHGIREPKISFISELARFYGVSCDVLLGTSPAQTPDAMRCLDNVAQALSIAGERFSETAVSAACNHISAILDQMISVLDNPFGATDPNLKLAVAVSESGFITAIRNQHK